MVSFWKRSQLFPPVLVRLLARHPHGAPLTEQEIAQRSGLQRWQVAALSWSTNWDGADVNTMMQFVQGCGVDFCNRQHMKRIDAYMRSRPTWKYLRRSGEWEPTYQPMIIKWRQSLRLAPSEPHAN